ncbi:hypothetical protein TCAL_05106 [Tigriopus californicus]|uniref:Peptidase S1 domain-containing protein n=1 Tax=Tigriopus californicus TaxID=6832 RepID=A0A553NUM8_TIGCA|nr:chymotrypsinogen B-like [Tigriopus californicus]TRY69124.1 hypothetical protein TCAL_05106 [Tigriopus californicus]|eukprot:TCALIF_05106-PA protein Name:"Similar to TMPRSS9 Transmembrane protease serine 9 (Homo sapiens)" AED:0.35 eAED:0.35 QI:0/0/0/0.66/1/1/3/0/292
MFGLRSLSAPVLLIIAISTTEIGARRSSQPWVNDPTCGIANDWGNAHGGPYRVGNGHPSYPHQFPWVGHLRSGQSFCTCSLIAERWALTAAHCVEDVPIQDIIASFGVHSLDGLDDPSVQKLGVQRVHLSSIGDIALLHLDKRAKFNSKVRPACLPLEVGDITGKTAYMKGFGRTEEFILPSELMLSQRGKIASEDVCAQELGPMFGKRLICTVLNDPMDPFVGKGDSGGPLDVLMADGKYYQVGVTSFHMIASLTSGFVDVRQYLPWILTWIDSNTNSDGEGLGPNPIHQF